MGRSDSFSRMDHLTVLTPLEGESWSAFVRRAEGTEGELLLVLCGFDEVLTQDAEERKKFFEACVPLRARARMATKRMPVIAAARLQGFRVFQTVQEIKDLLGDHPALPEVVRAFSPHLWRQHLRSRLQMMGLLSLPKLRVWILIFVSALLFLFVFLRLLPSAEIAVKPREDNITHTVNIFLVLSGATVGIPNRVRTMELKPLVVTIERTVTFDRISKEFSGEPSRLAMTILNTTDEPYSFRKGSRMANEAGMVFRISEPVVLEPGAEVTVPAVAEPVDTYGEIIGERGNVPAGVRWEFVGLPPAERKRVFGENRAPATGGTSSYRTVLKQEDIDVGKKQLEEELIDLAKQMVDEQRILYNAQHKDQQLELLYYDELTKVAYGGFVLPTQFVGQPVTSVPITASITYSAYAYDTQAVLSMLSEELKSHVREGKRLLEKSLTLSRLVAHVIDYADDLSWIKITVDLSGTEQYILDPLSPSGAHFAKDVRERVAGVSKQDAIRIVKNLPEVDSVEISLWPPWNTMLPPIPSHITLTTTE